MDYAEELAAKRQRVQDALTRLGGSDVQVEEILGAPNTDCYRNKSQYPIAPNGTVGFYRARSHEVIGVERCRLQMPQADAAAQAVRQYIRQFRVPCYDEKTGRGLLRHLYVRTNGAGESCWATENVRPVNRSWWSCCDRLSPARWVSSGASTAKRAM